MEQVYEFKYLECKVNNRGTKKLECENKVVNRRRVVGAIKALVNKNGLSLECASVLNESPKIPILMYGRVERV